MPTAVIQSHPSTISNPKNPDHLMRVRPIAAQVRVSAGGATLAQTHAALRLIEVGKDIYDPVVYVPKSALTDALVPVPDMTTHCPLKGDAHYFTLKGDTSPIAWIYDRTLPFAAVLKDHVGFYANRVTIEERGLEAP